VRRAVYGVPAETPIIETSRCTMRRDRTKGEAALFQSSTVVPGAESSL
jgi:hypothetical protein